MQFETFSSSPDVSFWHEYARRKIEIFKLDDTPVNVQGQFCNDNVHSLPARLALQSSSFLLQTPPAPFHFKAHGTVKICNTIEDFKDFDKKDFFQKSADQIWKDITSGEALKDPSLLNRFLVVSYGDLKKYRFHYWFAFPAFQVPDFVEVKEKKAINEVFLGEEKKQIQEKFETIRGYEENKERTDEFTCILVKNQEGIRLIKLTDWNQDTFKQNDEIYFICADPSALDKTPGWPSRNLIFLIASQYQKLNAAEKNYEIKFLFLRQWRKDILESSFTISLFFPNFIDFQTQPKAFGWEKDSKNKMRPKYIELSATMNPEQLAASQSALNLKLMKWKILPSLELEKIAETKCLLIGAGTLGCNVARVLIGWGVQNITFVDNGTVSYSNPVRQSLYNFQDCLNGGKPKATAAAESLRTISPSINAQGVILNVPMPGHSIPNDLIPETLDIVKKLDELIEQHDAIFLLTDSREARWLPTVIAAAKNKICINSALGFDSFLVIRHGCSPYVPIGPGECRVGCYFCNDISAPQDTQKHRTLDQQCTVTRPGLSLIASSFAVELLVLLLHHPSGNRATYEEGIPITQETPSPLGLIPHQIRGFLTHFSNVLGISDSFDKCTACSTTVINLYLENPTALVVRSLNEPGFLEDITGITELLAEVADVSLEWDDEFDD